VIKSPQILSEAYLKLAKWSFEFKEQLDKMPKEARQQSLDVSLRAAVLPSESAEPSQLSGGDFDKSIGYCQKATEIVETSAEAWHYYSQINYEASGYYCLCFAESFQAGGDAGVSKPSETTRARKQRIVLPEDYGEKIVKMVTDQQGRLSERQLELGNRYIRHIMNAIQGLGKVLQLADQSTSSDSSKTLQNTLRLMKIWFEHGDYARIDEIVRDSITRINLRVWINVIPQLLARIDIKKPMIKTLLLDLLERVSQRYPQALLYSLSVSKKSRTKERREAADALVSKMKLTQGTLIEQANMVSDELIRAAILLSESWSEAIEEASRTYFTNNDAETMIAGLKDLHAAMEREPETMNEINFYQGFACDLEEA
jgi:hypothetical protein